MIIADKNRIMEEYTAYVTGEKITIQEAPYIEDGWYVEIIGATITLWEIPYGGGEAMELNIYPTIGEAIEAAKRLT